MYLYLYLYILFFIIFFFLEWVSAIASGYEWLRIYKKKQKITKYKACNFKMQVKKMNQSIQFKTKENIIKNFVKENHRLLIINLRVKIIVLLIFKCLRVPDYDISVLHKQKFHPYLLSSTFPFFFSLSLSSSSSPPPTHTLSLSLPSEPPQQILLLFFGKMWRYNTPLYIVVATTLL